MVTLSGIQAQIVNEALKKYLIHNDKNINQLYIYAKQFRIQRIVREHIELLI
jgi:hypothetical protein